ncbi:TPA: iron chelate uptake ABC transporter family permease subunit [Pseudomonas aeruginosa]|uniref:iron chelate uptake ABC transporter family permease subunit n=1 Tax=Pseudomonas aeruginosa TaxID=287 RepID=UPI00071B99CC|nr:iron chelate uptake ABC transporter family permease subunit [Pseudomonas aeruginosa]AYW58563.1 iron ABC transporter permease [Pseudomonas aeruginosa]KSP42155.1 iron ABC transporter permease [Pseudomonas aeruginosa]MBX5587915.1 iron chelate uptake ABC transporter family permease subunit [Pseudomonas aeruginosa]MBX6217035.1 iron chelate uptake ABC transporter family permease subunit [Pseudomonas aeruginosa]MDP5563488.1 iron chelate uptake ABC transporter family permease subunit [Pseudomonas a
MTRVLNRYWLWTLVIAAALIFIFVQSGFDFEYVIPKRLNRLGAIVIGGVCVAVSSIVFQTIAGNRILTPAVMGYEAVYLLLQSLLTLVLGGHGLIAIGRNESFFLSIVFMLAYSRAVHRYFFKDGRRNVYFLLLLGLVLTMLFGTMIQFIQLKISPGDFGIVQGFIYASFNRAQPEQLAYAAVLVAAISIVLAKTLPSLDVLALGREQSLSLGLDYKRSVRLYLSIIAALVAVSTSLIGPTAFMGIFVANITYSMTKSTWHRLTLPTGCAVAVGIFIIAQLLVEHVFNYTTTVSILVNLVCGAYFLMLMVRTRGNA